MSQSILEFAETNNLRFIPVNVYYLEEKDEDGNPQKQYGSSPKGWKTLAQYAPEKCMTRVKESLLNHIFINLSSPKIIVVDCDSKETYKRFTELLNEYDGLYSEEAITSSVRGLEFNIPYKKHFYFNVAEDEYELFKNRFKGKYLGNGFDTFYLEGVQIAEHKETKIGNIPTIPFEEYETIFDTMKSEFRGATSQTSFEKDKPVKKEKKAKEDKKPLESNMDDEGIVAEEKLTGDQVLEMILDGISVERWTNYNDWKTISFIFTNEGLPDSLFHKYSELKCPEKYNYGVNQACLDSNIVMEDGWKIETLYYWLKKDNPKLFRELQLEKNDFWKMLKDFNHDDVAKFYYALEPTKYVRSEDTKEWYEYNENNILKSKGTKPPSSMLNNIARTLKEAILEKYETTKPKIIKDAEGNTIPDKDYESKIKLLDKCYRSIGSATFAKGAIDFLTSLYNVEGIDKKLDVDMTLLAFNDGVFDIKIGEFRKINPTDYITKTCGYNFPRTSDTEIKKALIKIISSMFPNKKMVDYLLTIRGLSLFTNKLQCLFIHTGKGGNGKSILSSLHNKALGEYFYQADNTFLTTIIAGGRANPTLVNCRGRRSLCISEPDDGSGSSKLNAEMIKQLTGGEDITARDLNKSNVTFKQTFTPDLLANSIPKLSKLDGGIYRRLKVINYPFSFVDTPNPKNEYEKLRDYNLQATIETPAYISEYILLLIEYAVKHYKDDIGKLETPNEVKEEIEEYIEENNPIKNWLTNCVVQNNSGKAKIKTSEAHKHYINSEYCEVKLGSEAFAKIMAYNKYDKKKVGGVYYYKDIELITTTEDSVCEIETL